MKLTNPSCILFFGVLLATSAVQSAVVVGLSATNEERGRTRFSYAIQEGAVQFDGGALSAGTAVSENSISGASGSFSVEWSATQRMENSAPFLWSFGFDNALLHLLKVGWGVSSLGDKNGDLQLGNGEVILLKFDLSDLMVEEGKQFVFSVSSASDESYRVYQRTGPETGKIVAMVNSDNSGESVSVPVAEGMEYAITDAGHDKGQALRLIQFSVDIVSNDEIVVPTLSDVASVKQKHRVSSNMLNVDKPVVEEQSKALGLIL